MAKRTGSDRTKPRERGRGDDDLVLERLRRHLEFLGLNRTLDELDDRLAWAARERPGATALLEHVLGVEAAHKLEQRVARRIDTSGLVERKVLEAFDAVNLGNVISGAGFQRLRALVVGIGGE